MVNLPINPISLTGMAAVDPVGTAPKVGRTEPAGNVFDELLGKAVDALNGVSESEMTANRLIDNYIAGKAELSDVMVATSKMTIAVNLAVTTITSAVSSFKEITQMPI